MNPDRCVGGSSYQIDQQLIQNTYLEHKFYSTKFSQRFRKAVFEDHTVPYCLIEHSLIINKYCLLSLNIIQLISIIFHLKQQQQTLKTKTNIRRNAAQRKFFSKTDLSNKKNFERKRKRERVGNSDHKEMKADWQSRENARSMSEHMIH